MTFTRQEPESRVCFVDCGKEAPECHCRARYPYTHHGPSVYGDKLTDFLVSESSLKEDRGNILADMLRLDEADGELEMYRARRNAEWARKCEGKGE